MHISDLELQQREIRSGSLAGNEHGMGRELFANFRSNVTSSETGATATF